jgi:hypothetical protein
MSSAGMAAVRRVQGSGDRAALAAVDILVGARSFNRAIT